MLDEAAGERAHNWPQLLPGGDVLFTVRRGTGSDVDASDIAVLNVATGKYQVIWKGGAFGQYSPTGHLLFVRGGTLSAVPFDRSSHQITGTAVPIIEDLAVDAWIGGAHYAVAPDGALVLMSGSFPRVRHSAVWVDRRGQSVPAAGLEGSAPAQPRISPDGNRAVFDSPSPEGDDEVYVADLVRGTAIRLSDDPRDDFDATWTADGRSVIWCALPPARLPFMVMRATDGTGRGEPLLPEPQAIPATGPGGASVDLAAQFPGSVSRGGVLAYTRASAAGASDIWTLSLEGDRKPQPFVASPAYEFGPEFSPDGKWVAYVSNESGDRDIYVVPYPGPGAKRRVTKGGGVSAAWSRDGRELFYQTREGLMVVDVRTDPALAFGTPRLLLRGNFIIDSREDGPRAYDVSPDGKKFLMLVSQPATTPAPAINVVLDWITELRKISDPRR